MVVNFGWLIAALLLVVNTSAQTTTARDTLPECIYSVGVRGLADYETQGWSGIVTLTVSKHLDASRVVLDDNAVKHLSFIAISVLPQLCFRAACAGKRLTFRVQWEPSQDGRSGMAVTKDTLIVTGYGLESKSRARRHGGPLDLTGEDLNNLELTDSIREFLIRRGINPDR